MKDFLSSLQGLVERGAFARLMRPCHRPCARAVLFEDFCQEVLVRAVEHRERFAGDSESQLAGWLRGIGHNVMAERLRRWRLDGHAPLTTDVAGRDDDPVAEADERQARLAWLVRVLPSLSAEERDLLTRHYRRRQSFAAIARDLGVPANTVVQRHARLLRRLRGLREE